MLGHLLKYTLQTSGISEVLPGRQKECKIPGGLRACGETRTPVYEVILYNPVILNYLILKVRHVGKMPSLPFLCRLF